MGVDFTLIIYSILIAFAVSVVLYPIFIPYLTRLKFGQNVRSCGPEAHLKKAGTPTMGGIVIVFSLVASSLLFVHNSPEGLIVLGVTVAFALVGFLDDYIKVVKKRSMGLNVVQKMLAEIVITAGFVWLLNWQAIDMKVFVPFTGKLLDLGVFTIPFIFIVVLGTVNGANFTDGLDGLASGVTVLIALFFLFIAYALNSPLVTIIGTAVGVLMGFLLFNAYPARLFMGDTGSLALGGFIAAVAIILGMPLLIPLVAFIYLAEVLSVALQVGFFKLTKGKRIFKMAPIHHHFEMLGWAETKVVTVFYITTAILCLIGFLATNVLFK